MGKPSRRKLERQRRRKAKRERRSMRPVVLAYRGNKYKTAELVLWHFQTEVGIYESFVMSGRRLTDHDVRAALQELVLQIRAGMPSIPDDAADSDAVIEGPRNLVIWNIRQNWRLGARSLPAPGRDALVGILRTILGSIEVWGSPSPTSRGYLDFIQEFLTDAGVSVEEVSPDDQSLPAEVRPSDDPLRICVERGPHSRWP